MSKSPRDGLDGLDGASAFEIARRHGFVGTEKEWLDSLRAPQAAPELVADVLIKSEAFASLIADAAKGKDGEPGQRGLPGKAGRDGRDGVDGKSAETLPAGDGFATFDMDEEGAVISMHVARLDGLGQARIVIPVRDADGVMIGAQINLA